MPEITQESITQAVNGSKSKHGKVVLAEVQRDLGISRGRARTLRRNGFVLKQNGKKGRQRKSKLDPFGDVIREEFLKNGITNSDVIYSNIVEKGYTGKLTIVKDFIKDNYDLVPGLRKSEALPNRVRRYETEDGQMFQMDWGFVNVVDCEERRWQCACFAMVCHHCGKFHVEFFPSARQENLFIGMIHAFMALGLPGFVYTDNMKSVVIRRDGEGNPIWNHDYDLFQKAIGFETKVAKIAHPWSKGAVERLVRYVKGNFIPGKRFLNISDMNTQVAAWCNRKNQEMSSGRAIVPNDEHSKEKLRAFALTEAAKEYLYPLRKISIDGFISIDGRLFGVPYSFSGKTVRVFKDGARLSLLDPLTYEAIYTHTIDWSKKPKVAIGQWAVEEKPTEPVRVVAKFVDSGKDMEADRLSRFSIMEGKKDDRS